MNNLKQEIRTAVYRYEVALNAVNHADDFSKKSALQEWGSSAIVLAELMLKLHPEFTHKEGTK